MWNVSSSAPDALAFAEQIRQGSDDPSRDLAPLVQQTVDAGRVAAAHGREDDAYALYLNHSFTPNLRLEERRMFALRDITVGEELTFNYLDTESGIASPFVCHDTGRPVDSKACTG